MFSTGTLAVTVAALAPCGPPPVVMEMVLPLHDADTCVKTSFGTAPSAVEYALAAAVDDLETKAYQARIDWPQAGICEAVRFDFALADNPDYLMFSGTERRVWPFGVNATQSLATPI